MNIPTHKTESILKGGEIYRRFHCSDLHIGAEDFNRKAFRYEMDRAVGMGAKICIHGDVGEFIQHQDRKRYLPEGVSPSIARIDAQLDGFIDDIVTELKPYAEHIELISYGNHEASIIKYHGIDPLKAIVRRLYELTGHNIAIGGYRGAIFHRFWHNDSRKNSSVHVTYYWHGTGGGAKVTKGMIDFNRMRNDYFADLYITAHKHRKITDTGDPMVYWDTNGNICAKEVKAAQVGTFKGKFTDDGSICGFSDMNNFTPAAPGGVMVEFEPIYNRNSNSHYDLNVRLTT